MQESVLNRCSMLGMCVWCCMTIMIRDSRKYMSGACGLFSLGMQHISFHCSCRRTVHQSNMTSNLSARFGFRFQGWDYIECQGGSRSYLLCVSAQGVFLNDGYSPPVVVLLHNLGTKAPNLFLPPNLLSCNWYVSRVGFLSLYIHTIQFNVTFRCH